MPEITKELIEARLALYRKEAQELMRMIEVYKGGIQDCEHWLSVLEKQDPHQPEK